MEDVMDATRRLCAALKENAILHQVDGDAAIYLHISAKDGSFPSITRAVDVLVDRAKVTEMLTAVERAGLEEGNREIRVEARTLFGGGVVRLISCPTAELEDAPILVSGLPVTALKTLVRRKLEKFRLQDKLHVQEMDDVGLITPEIEAGLSEILRARLAEVRATE